MGLGIGLGDAALDQVHDVRVGLELAELRHEALQVHPVHGLECRLARLHLRIHALLVRVRMRARLAWLGLGLEITYPNPNPDPKS